MVHSHSLFTLMTWIICLYLLSWQDFRKSLEIPPSVCEINECAIIFYCSILCLLMAPLHIPMLQCIPMVAYMLTHLFLRYFLVHHALAQSQIVTYVLYMYNTMYYVLISNRDLILLVLLLCLLQTAWLRLL